MAKALLDASRVSLDTHRRMHRGKPETALINEALSLLDQVSFSFNTNDFDALEVNLALSVALGKIREIPHMVETLNRVHWVAPVATTDEPELLRAFFQERISVYESLTSLEDLMLEYAQHAGIEAAESQALNLSHIVPDQKIAPVQFEISNNRIVIAHRASPFKKADRANIEAARAELQRNGDRIVSELQQSNCDRRLLSSVQELHAQLQGEINAIKIGLMNINCEMMCKAYEAELPTALASILRAYNRGVQMFVAQFSEWERFVKNAAIVDLDQADIESLKAASKTLVEEMKKQPELIDPEVPRTFAYLSEMVTSPTKAGKRVAFALLRSLENLTSPVFGYGTDFLEKTAEKSVDRASTAASRVVVGLLLVGLTVAGVAIPASSKIPDMNWMKTAAEIIKKQLAELTGTSPGSAC